MSSKTKLLMSMFVGGWAASFIPTVAGSQEVPGGAPPPPAVWRVQNMVDSIGVVTHIAYNAQGYAYENVTSVIGALQYLGVTNIREALPNVPIGDPRLQRYYDLLDTGLKLSLTASICCGTGTNPGTELIQADKTNLDDFETKYPGQIIAAEGLNEPDLINNGYIYKFNQYQGASAVAHHQVAFYSMVHSDPNLKGIPVWEFSLNSPPYNQVSYEQVYGADSSVMRAFDYANTGDYTGTWSPEFKMRSSLFFPYDIGYNNQGQFVNGVYEPNIKGKPMILKETGFISTTNGDVSISATDYNVQAKMTPGLFFDSFILGASHSFNYELADLYTDPNNTNLQYHWGLFNNSLQAKPAATVLRNVLATLKDTGQSAKTFRTTTITASVPQFPLYPVNAVNTGSGFTVVGENSAGTYFVLIWYEPLLWNAAQGVEYPVPQPVPVTLNLSITCAKTQIYDPYTNSLSTGPTNVASIPVSLPDHALIVTCQPG